MNNITGIKKSIVYGAVFGGLCAAALGVGTGLAQAESGVPSTSSHHVSSYDRGDQDVVRRGTVIPIHGDDEHPRSVNHSPAAAGATRMGK
ncbi:hypothetical protein [Mycolicibacterium sphagni]|uniref:hypothetical protein n=1 Tax=Mycolicibacterium sphagni TaxID=1786 RepID=UPI0021F39F55|nr:hypothetical protein [Mycolicibacterium sphagni]MCV7179321.1 hypothetical protein [Mycolicibacterium sphagni]